MTRPASRERWQKGEDLRECLAIMGNPQDDARTLLVAGTNGKGSTGAFLRSILAASGERVVQVASPMITGSTTCIVRDRAHLVYEREALAARDRLLKENNPPGATITLPRFDKTFAEAYAVGGPGSWLVAEPDCGAATDVTRVLDPVISVVTNVQRDHIPLLGWNLTEVAEEKAGAIRPGVPAMCGAMDPGLRHIFERRAAEVGAPLTFLDPEALTVTDVSLEGTAFVLDTDAWGRLELVTNQVGRHQAHNAALAILALQCLPESERPEASAIREGLRYVFWPARFDVREVGGRTFILDVAHNPDGRAAVAQTLQDTQPPRPWSLISVVIKARNLEPVSSLVDATSVFRTTKKKVGEAIREVTPYGAKHVGVPRGPFGDRWREALEAAGPGGTVVAVGTTCTFWVDAMLREAQPVSTPGGAGFASLV